MNEPGSLEPGQDMQLLLEGPFSPASAFGRLEASEEGTQQSAVSQVVEGIRWLQKHPVLAAAIWVFGRVVARSGGSSSRKEDDGAPETLPRAVQRLSWSDEHGGSLAQYYSDRERGSESGSDAGLYGEAIHGHQPHQRAGNGLTGPHHAHEGVHLHHCTTFYDGMTTADIGSKASSTASLLPLSVGPSKPPSTASASGSGKPPSGAGSVVNGVNGDTSMLPHVGDTPGTWSPQCGWGWYVSMTPPGNEHFPAKPKT